MRFRAVALILTLVLGLLTVPLPAEAQKAGKVYRVGWLEFAGGAAENYQLFEAFLRGLRDLGWVEGDNIVIDYRSAQGDYRRVASFAADLVNLNADAIVASRTPAALAVKEATTTIPIVMVWVDDPVGAGLVASLGRPTGNVTGLTNVHPELMAKQLELLKEAVPSISRVAVLWDPNNPGSQLVLKQTEAAAQTLGVTLQSVEMANLEPTALQEPPPELFERAFSAMTRKGADAVMVVTSGVMLRREFHIRIADLALEHRLPVASNLFWLTERGGLMSYSPSIVPIYRRVATFVDKILSGANPADLPVEQPTKFELVINLKTAKALGLTIPPSVLVRAHEVIE